MARQKRRRDEEKAQRPRTRQVATRTRTSEPFIDKLRAAVGEEPSVDGLHARADGQDVVTAAAFRRIMEEEAPLHPCAVCACVVAARDKHEVPLSQLPHKDLLLADVPATDDLPRHALTTVSFRGRRYCLSPDGVVITNDMPCTHCGQPDDADTMLICDECF